MAENLKEKTARGLLWGALNNGGQQMLNLVFGIFLGRLLSPADYGMVGMLAIFSLLASNLQESGFISALNRKKEATQDDYNAVFWFNVLMAATIYAVLWLCAPLIAAWFREPALIPLARFTFISFVVSALGTTPRAYLFRNLRVKDTAWMSLTALFVSGVTGVVLAWQGFSYWGIAVQNLVYCAMMSALAWRYSGWRPSLRLDFRPLRGMIGFSSKLLATNCFTAINGNIFAVFFGPLYGERIVGFYNQGNKWTQMGYNFLNGTLWNVSQPVFARLEGDADTQRRAFRKMLRFTTFVSCPVLFGLALIAPEFITLLVGPKWLSSADLMQLLSIGGAFIPIATFYSNYLVSQGRSNLFMWNTIGLCLAQIAALLALYPYGITAMVLTFTALNILWVPLWHIHVKRLLGITFRQAAADILPFVVLSAMSAILAHIVGDAMKDALIVDKVEAAALVELYSAHYHFAGETFYATAALSLPLVAAVLLVKAFVAVVMYVTFMFVLRVTIFRESVVYLWQLVRRKK